VNFQPTTLLSAAFLLSVFPIIFGVASSYLKISIVLQVLKNALGLQQSPGILAEVVLALALTGFIMGPIFEEVLPKIKPLVGKGVGSVSSQEIKDIFAPWLAFLDRHTGRSERDFIIRMRANNSSEKNIIDSDIPEESILKWFEVIPAFLLSELKEALLMGVALLTPFVIIDLVVAQLLTGLGMMMVSPTLVALPLKLLLFAVTNGWILLSESLILSYQ
jgi:type III secretory pathway component EscR